MPKKYNLLKPDQRLVKKIQQAAGCSSIVATIIANRQVKTQKELDLFLSPTLNKMRSPFSLAGIQKAVERIHRALIKKEKILVFVDYDADGVCSGAILVQTLRHLGADVQYLIPHRHTDGYGLTEQHITDVVIPGKFSLLITADCGSTASLPISRATERGIDVIVTDHHEVDPCARVNAAYAFVNPKDKGDCSGLADLAGVGVAFYLIVCLRSYLREKSFFNPQRPEPNLKGLADLVCIGTIADCVPLVHDNRILVNAGLEVLRSGKTRPGVKALLEVAGIEPAKITSTDVGFKMAPRINAASRMAHANTAIELFLSEDEQTAKKLAAQLNQYNEERKLLVEKILAQIGEKFEADPSLFDRKALILSDRSWPTGVLGIIAGKIAEKYQRPAIIISLDEKEGKGSARSVPGVDIYKCLSSLSGYLVGFGGHNQAAGLKISLDQIEPFKAAVEQYMSCETLTNPEQDAMVVDYEIGFEEISEALVSELQKLEPFGQCNPEPVFLARNIRSSGAQVLKGGHRKMYLAQPVSESERTYSAIHFNAESTEAAPADYQAVAFKLAWNHWRGKQTIQFIVLDAA
ncbi:MAG: single-stranded-DNA-specific exonuclease RecJ [Desulfobacteraceae bacterium]|nr:single-stranded-DNA-specific exonuclease RecJ [Desulfobacteraceae bacterium]